MRLVILARKGISIVARVRWQKKTRYMCIFFVLNVAKHQKCFYKTHAVRNSCSKGNIDRSKSALAGKDKINVFSIYTLSDLGVLSNVIGSLSLANEHYSPLTE